MFPASCIGFGHVLGKLDSYDCREKNSNRGSPGAVLQSLPTVRPPRTRVVDRLPLMIQVFALHPPPYFIPLHSIHAEHMPSAATV